MKYLFFKDTDITLEQYESIFQDPSDAVRETWQTITRLEGGWFMVLANDNMELPFPNVDIDHVYNTFVKMPAGPKISVKLEEWKAHATVKSAIESNERRVFISPDKSREWIEGYNAFLFDKASPGKISINPYSRGKEYKKARDWDSGYEKSLSDFDESTPSED